MAQVLIIWFINALTLLVVSQIVPGFEITSFYTALIVALVLGLVNAIIRPVVLLLTLPLTILTLGLFTLVVNALMLWFVQSFVKGFTITSFNTALVAAIVLCLISFVSNVLASRLHHPPRLR